MTSVESNESFESANEAVPPVAATATTLDATTEATPSADIPSAASATPAASTAPAASTTPAASATPAASTTPAVSLTTATSTTTTADDSTAASISEAQLSDEKNDEKETSVPIEKPSTEEPPERPTQQSSPQRSSQYSQYQNYYPPQPKGRFLDVPLGLPYPFFLHNNFLMLFIFIGMILTLLGGIMSGWAIIVNNIDIYGASVITISMGLFTLSTFITLAALFREDLDHFVRLGLLITSAFLIFGLILNSRFGF